MPAYQAEAIVLRHASYREGDRMVTLFAPEHGRIEALAKGSRKPGGTMTIASELFSAGVYQLYNKGGRTTLTGFSLIEGHYPLRTDVERLAYGCYALGLCAAVLQPDAPEPELYASLRRALALLAYGTQTEQAVICAFLLSFSACLGIEPELEVCAHCAKPLAERAAYDREAGGLCCPACMPHGIPISPSGLQAVRALGREGYDACAAMTAEDAAVTLRWLRAHVEYHVQGSVQAAKFLSLLE